MFHNSYKHKDTLIKTHHRTMLLSESLKENSQYSLKTCLKSNNLFLIKISIIISWKKRYVELLISLAFFFYLYFYLKYLVYAYKLYAYLLIFCMNWLLQTMQTKSIKKLKIRAEYSLSFQSLDLHINVTLYWLKLTPHDRWRQF